MTYADWTRFDHMLRKISIDWMKCFSEIEIGL